MKITKIICCENFHVYCTYPCVCLCVHLPIFLWYVSCKSVCVCIYVYCLYYVYLSSIDMCDCVHAFMYIAIYVTGSGKTGLIVTITDIHFLPVRESCTHALPQEKLNIYP